MEKISFVLYTVCISPHQLPLMRQMIARLGAENCLYIYTEKLENGRIKLGWNEESEPRLIHEGDKPMECREILKSCTVLMSGIRDFDLFEWRAIRMKTTLYSSERWFKPILLSWPFAGIAICGWFKLLQPSYLRMALRLRRLMTQNGENGFHYFPISMYAAMDAVNLCGSLHPVDFIREPGGMLIKHGSSRPSWAERLRLWAYFVDPSSKKHGELASLRQRQYDEVYEKRRPLRILWVGRMLDWKNVHTIIKAVRLIADSERKERKTLSLTLIGDGPEKLELMRLAQGLPVDFKPFMPISQIREIMREHDLYILASNSFEGWGAVVNEALEEQMYVLASRQSGAGATVLPENCLFDCHNARELASRILDFDNLPRVDASPWSASEASKYLVQNFLS